jgi:CheY-like chemotaxis protein
MAKILIIEDNENNRVLLSRRLKAQGYEVFTAEDAEKGLPMVTAMKPDLVLMDLGLPGMDGWTATRLLRADPNLRDLPIIALTAHAMQSDREKAVETGCNGFETKPVDFPRLFETMEALLSRRGTPLSPNPEG